MENVNVVITGGTDGMGKATALRLAQRGARVLIVSRDARRCAAAVSDLRQVTGNDQIEFRVADLSSVGAVRRVAGAIREARERVDVLVHSAGGAFPKQRTMTEEGLELSFALQYLGRFALTRELIEPLQAAPAPRVLAVAGGGSWSKGLDLDDLQSEKSYGRFAAIGKASASNDLLTLELTRRHPEIAFYNYGPGIVRTKILMGDPLARAIFGTVGRLVSRTPEQAADDIAELLTGDHPAGFYGPKLQRHHPNWATAHPSAQGRLWELSEEIVLHGSPLGGGDDDEDARLRGHLDDHEY